MHHKALVLASLAADSLALCAHWIYDAAKIDRTFGRITEPRFPLKSGYHNNRKRGDFTHYGDQALLLLQSISEHGGFTALQFGHDWQDMMRSYDGYHDKATKHTLSQIAVGMPLLECGSSSTDLGGASRICGLVYRYHDQPEMLRKTAREQTSFTHNNPAVMAGAEFLATVTRRVLYGLSPIEAIEQAVEEGIADIELDMKIRLALDSAGKNSRESLKAFGLDCRISAALPGAVHLVATYQEDLETALIENVMAGGDSAARGLAAGMILGAHNGIEAIPNGWLSNMNGYPMVMNLLEECS